MQSKYTGHLPPLTPAPIYRLTRKPLAPQNESHTDDGTTTPTPHSKNGHAFVGARKKDEAVVAGPLKFNVPPPPPPVIRMGVGMTICSVGLFIAEKDLNFVHALIWRSAFALRLTEPLNPTLIIHVHVILLHSPCSCTCGP